MTMEVARLLAHRQGKTVHVSPLRMKVARLQDAYPCEKADALEEWLVATANARGVRVVVSPAAPPRSVASDAELSDEESAVALCQLNCLDRPQMLRLAAQIISRGRLDLDRLVQVAIRERAEPVLAKLARLALRVEPEHAAWVAIHRLFGGQPPLREPLLHWTRLAEPLMKPGAPNAAGWRLVA